MKGFILGLLIGTGIAGTMVFADDIDDKINSLEDPIARHDLKLDKAELDLGDRLPDYFEKSWMIVGTNHVPNFWQQLNRGAEDTFIFMPTRDALYVGIEGRYTRIEWKDLDMFVDRNRRTR